MFDRFRKPRHHPGDIAAARGLGVASIAIGLTELLAPRRVEEVMGLENGRNTGILRTLGVREIMHGVDLLANDDPAPGVDARLAGDALDGVLLGLAAGKTRNPAGFLAVVGMVAGVVALDVVLARRFRDR